MKTSQLALELLLPTKCAVCGKSPSLLCEKCKPSACVEFEDAEIAIWSAMRYSDEFPKIINAYKEANRTALANYLTQLLDTLLGELQSRHNFERIVFAASSQKNYQKRGFNPVQLLLRKSVQARRYSTTKLPLVRETLDQVGLSRLERQTNLNRAFSAPKNLHGCLILDDISTTGATLAAMSEAITSAGGTVVAWAVLAKTFKN